jgi:hypothetical protein
MSCPVVNPVIAWARGQIAQANNTIDNDRRVFVRGVWSFICKKNAAFTECEFMPHPVA